VTDEGVAASRLNRCTAAAAMSKAATPRMNRRNDTCMWQCAQGYWRRCGRRGVPSKTKILRRQAPACLALSYVQLRVYDNHAGCVSCELVCVCVSLVRAVIICPASTHTRRGRAPPYRARWLVSIQSEPDCSSPSYLPTCRRYVVCGYPVVFSFFPRAQCCAWEDKEISSSELVSHIRGLLANPRPASRFEAP